MNLRPPRTRLVPWLSAVASLLGVGCGPPSAPSRATPVTNASVSSGSRAPAPSVPSPSGRLRAIASTENFTCALDRDGVVRCTENAFEGASFRSPTIVYDNLGAAVGLASARGTLCVNTADGAVRCMGDALPGEGERAPGAEPWRPPHAIAGLASVAGVAAGQRHACAWTNDGAAFCWGDNRRGQLGNGTTETQPGAARVQGIEGVTAMAAGESHTCALLRDGTVRCWGANRLGQLGDGTTADRTAPAPVPELRDAVGVYAGGPATCARLRDGAVRCWGWLNSALADATCALASGETQPCRRAPVAVPALNGALQISLRDGRVCALLADDRVACVVSDATPQTVAFDHAPPACLDRASRETAKVFSVAMRDDGTSLAYCLGDHSDDLRPIASSCWSADLTRGAITPAPHPVRGSANASVATEDRGPFTTAIQGTTVRVCAPGGGGCREVAVESFGAASQEERPFAHEAHATHDGAVLVTVNHAGEFESWEAVTGRRLARFRVRSASPDAELGRVRVLGATLLVTHCEGPQCEGRLVDPRTGRVLGVVAGANMAGVNVFKVREGLWAFVDGRGAAVHWYQVTTGRRVRPPLALPASDDEGNTTAARRNAEEVVIVYGGAGSDTEQPQHVGGDVVRVNLVTGRVVQRITPALCEGAQVRSQPED